MKKGLKMCVTTSVVLVLTSLSAQPFDVNANSLKEHSEKDNISQKSKFEKQKLVLLKNKKEIKLNSKKKMKLTKRPMEKREEEKTKSNLPIVQFQETKTSSEYGVNFK